MSERGYRIGNLDVTLILQTPKVVSFSFPYPFSGFFDRLMLNLIEPEGEGYQTTDEAKPRITAPHFGKQSQH